MEWQQIMLDSLIPWSKLEYRNVGFPGGRWYIGSASRLGCLDAPAVLSTASASRCRETPRLKTEPTLNNPENSGEKAISSLFTDPPFSLLEVVERAYENKNRVRFIDRKGKRARGWEIRKQMVLSSFISRFPFVFGAFAHAGNRIGHFRVSPGLCIKTRLSA